MIYLIWIESVFQKEKVTVLWFQPPKCGYFLFSLFTLIWHLSKQVINESRNQMTIFILCLILQGEKIQGFKRLNPLGFQDDKIPPKSPRPRRNIWLSRSQSDVFSCKPGRKVNVQDPYYNPPTAKRASKARKINPFTAREDLCGGKIKFFDVPSKSVFSLVFDLHSPPGSVFSNQPPAHGPGGPQQETSYYWQQLPGRQCHSLPVSPQLPRSEIFHLAAVGSSTNNGSVTCNSSQLSTTLPGEVSQGGVLVTFLM